MSGWVFPKDFGQLTGYPSQAVRDHFKKSTTRLLSDVGRNLLSLGGVEEFSVSYDRDSSFEVGIKKGSYLVGERVGVLVRISYSPQASDRSDGVHVEISSAVLHETDSTHFLRMGKKYRRLPTLTTATVAMEGDILWETVRDKVVETVLGMDGVSPPIRSALEVFRLSSKTARPQSNSRSL